MVPNYFAAHGAKNLTIEFKILQLMEQRSQQMPENLTLDKFAADLCLRNCRDLTERLEIEFDCILS